MEKMVTMQPLGEVPVGGLVMVQGKIPTPPEDPRKQTKTKTPLFFFFFSFARALFFAFSFFSIPS